MFGVTILGNNSALPAYDRHPTAQVVTLNDQLFLVDCGEGTQIQLSRYKIRRSRINHIFISHMHGDHYLGLTGILTSFGLMNREADLHIYAPAILKQIIDLQFAASDTRLPYTIHFHPLKSGGEIIVEEETFTVESFNVYHRIECWGFIIREKKKLRKIDGNRISNYTIPKTYYDKLKDGDDYITDNGELIKNELVTIPNSPNRSYAYCADTVYNESICPRLKDINLLYHETTYLNELEERAASRFHSTTVQAGNIALLSGAKKLLIGHFSSKYESLDDFLTETVAVFPQTQLAIEGVTYIIR